MWTGLAILLVVLAVLLSLFRFALPQLDRHKHLVQNYVEEEFGVDLEIGSIAATWKGSGPSIILSDVSLTQVDASPVQFTVDKVWVDIDFWQSISERLLISERFEIQDANLLILPEEFETSETDSFPIVDALQNLFLVQLQRFTITDGEVVVRTSSQEQTYDLDSLTWVNDGPFHQGTGNIRLRELANNSASFVAELEGEVGALSGTLFAKADSLDVSPWVNEWLTTKYPLQESRANLSAWASVENNRLDQFHIELGPSNMEWVGDGAENWVTEVNSGSIQARPDRDGWAFRVDQLVISQDGKTFVTDLIGLADTQGNAVVNSVKPIPLEPVTGILPLFIGAKASKDIQKMRPNGELATMQMKWESQTPSVRAKILDVSWQSVDKIPGLDAMDLEFVWHGAQGRIKATAEKATLDTYNLLGKQINDISIDSEMFVYFDEDSITPGWVLSMPNTVVDSENVSFDLQFKHEISSQFMQIALSIDALSIEHVPSLLPAPLMGKGTVRYLTRAFSEQGMIEGASLIWSGDPGQFPFDNNEGIFQASVAINDADFLFSSKWPSLTALDMTLLFENDALYLQSPTGQLDDVSLKQLNAVIPELSGSSGIYISAEGESTGENVATLIGKSNLQKLAGLLNRDVLVEGDVSARLFLDVPFTGEKVHASGSVQLNQANVHIPSIDVALIDANGELAFENSTISAKQLTASLYNQPVAVAIEGNQDDDDYMLDVGLNGTWDSQATLNQFRVPLSSVLSGEMAWDANIQVQLSKGNVAYQGQIYSDLIGVTSTMPTPLNKEAQQQKNLLVTVVGNGKESQLDVELGEQARFSGVLNHKPMTFARSRLLLGRETNYAPAADHAVVVSLPVLNVDDWESLKHSVIAESNALPVVAKRKRHQPLFAVPDRVYVESDLLQKGTQLFDNARISAEQENLHWRVDMTSKQAIGLAVIPANWKRDGINVFAEKLHLRGKKQSEAAFTNAVEDASDKLLFPLRFRCDDCRFNEYVLGKVDLELQPNEDGVNIERLNVNHPYGSLMAKGQWFEGKGANTQLTGQFKSSDFGQLLDSVGVSSGIKDSEADIEFNIGWQGTPEHFDLATLSGDMEWELSDGYLTQVSDKGSRIFTLFSLNSLVRKLSLDFRDVFAQGFFYDDISGTLVFEQGKATTQDTVVDGGAGEIEIVGYTQLNTEELNYNISFTPNVTGNLPFLVYFLANPPTAMAALALDQMLTSAKVISNINYRVTGTFDDPVVEEVGRDSKDISLPASNPAVPKTEDSTLDKSELERVNLDVSDT